MRGYLALARADSRSVARDPILLLVLIMSAVPLALFVVAGDAIDRFVEESFGLTGFRQSAVVFVLVLPACLLGWVTGMLLVEDRDEGVLQAVRTTPIGQGGYVMYRCALIFVLAWGLALLTMKMLAPAYGMAPWVCSLVALEAVLIALATVTLAGNKVQALALSKLLNLFALVPLLALSSSLWRFLAAPLPSFWVGELLFGTTSGWCALGTLLVGFGVHIGVGILLLRHDAGRA